MADTFDITQTRPYLSLLLLKLKTGSAQNSEVELREAIKKLLDLGGSGSRMACAEGEEGGLGKKMAYAFTHYTEKKAPSWTLNPHMLEDQLNQLVIVCRFEKCLGIYCSDSDVKSSIQKAVHSKGAGDPWDRFAPVTREILDTAFMGGHARTLWLRSIHRRTALKADSKILSGVELQSALNPLDDQSYHYTAARSLTTLGTDERPVGIAHKKSSLWLSSTKNWPEFETMVHAILSKVHTTAQAGHAKSYKMPFLADPVSAPVGKIGKPFEISFVPPELISDQMEFSTTDRELAEKWAYRSEFTGVRMVKNVIEATALLDAKKIGAVSLTITGITSQAKITVSGNKEPSTDEEDWKELLRACKNVRWLKIRFESGITLSDGSFFQMQFRDYSFENWSFQNFGEGYPTGSPDRFNPSEEKPTVGAAKAKKFSVNNIGHKKSLFCWVVKNWFSLPQFGSPNGHLFCDDGANEIADFVHIDTGNSDRVTLIHIKGSGNDTPERQISVSDYEIVCSQAIKNLRALDQSNLKTLVRRSLTDQIVAATWEDGILQADRQNVISHIDGMKSNYPRRVVIIQPRVTETRLDKAKQAGANSLESRRLKQLDTLLLEAEAGCRALGADFFVIGSKI